MFQIIRASYTETDHFDKPDELQAIARLFNKYAMVSEHW